MNEVSEFQRRRAENMIWNAAQSHAFTPDFKAYDEDASADLYWNTVIGAVRRHYDYPRIEALFRSFQNDEDADIYETLLWLGLENAVFEREREDRPVLQALRQSYAERFLSRLRQSHDLPLCDRMSYGHYCRVLGRDPGLDSYNAKLLDELEFSREMDTDQIVARAKELFAQWFQIRLREKQEERKKNRFRFGLGKGKKLKGRYRKFGLGFADHPSNLYGGQMVGKQDEEIQRLTTMSAQELRVFMEAKYGKSIFGDRETRELEQSICTGNHASCHVLITKGEKGTAKIQNGFEALQREREARQIVSNRLFFTDHLAERRTAIDRLTGKIQNSVLLHLQPTEVRANTGALEGGRAWRALHLNDEKVFRRTEQGNMGDLCVDILLDASTSQSSRQSIVSNQGYIIAASMDRCSIPCRVMSFCSMTGYTILRIFRDYYEKNANGKIFEYVSNGCNRDGLGIRLAHQLIKQESFDHRILIILSDAKPNDVVKIHRQEDGEYINYELQSAIRDTALEVRSARADGISVVCVFTGDDEDVASAKLIYGRDFARIQSLDKLADTVGLLLQNQIKNM